jgi:hypothetical protein
MLLVGLRPSASCVLVAAAAAKRAQSTAPRPKRRTASKVPKEVEGPGSAEAHALDLHACVPRGKAFDSVERWVAFADLHVSPSTLPTCMEVLRVRAAAWSALGRWTVGVAAS